MEYKKRIIDDVLKDKLEYTGAVSITGPKWCGKTETANQITKSAIDLSDPEMSNNIYLQEKQYSKLLDDAKPMLIDEWQTYPEIWNTVKKYVDKSKQFGEFILTGSANPADDRKLHPGTGRIAILPMKPMSLFESGESNGKISLKDVLDNSASFDDVKSTITYEEIADLVCRGGFPSVLHVKKEHKLKIARDYFKSLCETDIKKYNNEKLNPILAKAVLKAYARNVHTVCTVKTIFNDVRNIYGDVSDPTIYNYINALKRLFILEEIPAWNPNIRSKTVIEVSPKRSFVDPSIAVAALETSPQELMNDAKTLGFLFENLVYRDLSVYAESIGGYIRHYRDRLGLECDLVAHFDNGKYGLIEVKLGASAIEEAKVHLLELKNTIKKSKKEKEPNFLMIITGANVCTKTEEGIYIVSIDCLKN